MNRLVWPALQEDGTEWGSRAGQVSTTLVARNIAVYIRNSGTFATAVITGGDPDLRVNIAIEILVIAGRPDFVFEDQTGALRSSMRQIGGWGSAWTGVRMGGVSAPYGGYLEAIRPVLSTASRIVMDRISGIDGNG